MESCLVFKIDVLLGGQVGWMDDRLGGWVDGLQVSWLDGWSVRDAQTKASGSCQLKLWY